MRIDRIQRCRRLGAHGLDLLDRSWRRGHDRLDGPWLELRESRVAVGLESRNRTQDSRLGRILLNSGQQGLERRDFFLDVHASGAYSLAPSFGIFPRDKSRTPRPRRRGPGVRGWRANRERATKGSYSVLNEGRITPRPGHQSATAATKRTRSSGRSPIGATASRGS